MSHRIGLDLFPVPSPDDFSIIGDGSASRQGVFAALTIVSFYGWDIGF
jgi:hypothetical protein